MSAERRYQVFVSSTFSDLVEERRAIMQALLSVDHFPAGMELFPATNEDQWALIKSVIDDSDYYVVVVGGRYGSTTEEGISYTEKEFDYAVEQKKPVLAFLHGKPETIPAGKTDQNDKARERLDQFREKVGKGRHIKYWATPGELHAAVLQAIVLETKKNPQEGWVRGAFASDPATLSALREEIRELRNAGPPKDINLYLGGSDDFDLSVEYRLPGVAKALSHDVKISWDEIFREIGPLLMQEATEDAMRNRLATEALFYMDDEDKNARGGILPKIANEEFDTIKIQLFALGLIQRGRQKRAIADKNVYWMLTSFGEEHLMRLRALRKKPNIEASSV